MKLPLLESISSLAWWISEGKEDARRAQHERSCCRCQLVAVDLVEDLLELTVACVLKDKGGSLVLNWLKMNSIVGVNEEEETKRKKESINSGNS